MAYVLLGLDKLEIETVFCGEFKISYQTHKNHNWQQKGTHYGVPVAGFQESYNCIVAVTKERLVHFKISKLPTNSSVFCAFVKEMSEKMQDQLGKTPSEWVMF
jgi:hypothetical protein